MPPPEQNISGFDIKKLARAAGHQPSNDPWRRAEAWRYTGQFTRWNRLKGAFPGLGWGAGLFAVYMVYEQLFMQDSHDHGHGEEHD